MNTARPETFLAFDVGRKRTGVAFASRWLGRAEPQGTIQAEGERRWPLVARHIDTWQPQALVVGVPFHPEHPVCPSLCARVAATLWAARV